jgi:chemotaxis protein MotA
MAGLLDPVSLFIVFGGTVTASAVTASTADLRRALRALKPMLTVRPDRNAEMAHNALRQIQRIADYKGTVCIDRVKTPLDFVHKAACRLADADSSEAFRHWARAELDERRARQEGAIAVWRSAADAAPAMGMIGTVLGLFFMFGSMNEPSAMGPAMATAMLTTLYGLVISAGIAGPVATRLERLSVAERRWQQEVLDALERLARAEEEAVRHWTNRRRVPA